MIQNLERNQKIKLNPKGKKANPTTKHKKENKWMYLYTKLIKRKETVFWLYIPTKMYIQEKRVVGCKEILNFHQQIYLYRFIVSKSCIILKLMYIAW